MVLGQAYELNCSSEIFDSKWPWCAQFIYHQESQIFPPSLVLCRVTQMLHKDSAVKNVKCHRNALWVRQKCPRFGPVPTMEQLLHKPRTRPFAQGASERAEPFSLGRHLLFWQCLAQTSKEGSCSALILHLIIPLFTVSRCEEAFHFLEHCCIQTRQKILHNTRKLPKYIKVLYALIP